MMFDDEMFGAEDELDENGLPLVDEEEDLLDEDEDEEASEDEDPI